MATKKTASKPKRKSPAKAAPKRKPKRGLSTGFNKANLMAAAKSLVSSGLGGIAAPYANRAMSNTKNKWVRILILAVPAIGARMAGFQSVGDGFFGGVMALNTENGILSEDYRTRTQFANDESLADTPIFLSENDVPMKMLNDGSLVELSETELMQLETLMENEAA